MVENKDKLNVPATNDDKRPDETKNQISLSPLVYWAQNPTQITLKIDLKDAKSPNIDFTSKSLNFTALGFGARGVNHYSFQLNFYGFVNDEECRYRLYDNKIEIFIEKCEPGWWPRLVATPQKPHWLKIDFDRWCTEDDMLEEEQKPRNVMEDYGAEYERLQKEEHGYIKESYKKVYMIFYNLAQFVGYLYILCVLGILYYRDGMDAMPKAYESAGGAMKFCQLLQYLEVLHPIFGYTKGGALVPFFQVSGRNFVLFIMIVMEERMQTKPVVFYLFVIWSLVEIVRYPYYISQLMNKEVGLITWLRYTMWIPLYPMGIVCEGICILRNIPYFEETKRLSVELPNKWNSAFDMPSFLKIYLFLLALPGSYLVMSHMAKLRAKKLKITRKTTRTHID